MAFLVRKIDRGKWVQNDILNGADVSADAITLCMKTSNNTLSTFKIEQLEMIDEAVLALISNSDHLDAIDIVIFRENELIEKGIEIKETPGIIPVERLKYTHRDIAFLNYERLGILKDLTISEFKSQSVKRYSKGDLKKILRKAVAQGDRIKPGLMDKLN